MPVRTVLEVGQDVRRLRDEYDGEEDLDHLEGMLNSTAAATKTAGSR